MIEHLRNLVIDLEKSRHGGDLSYASFVYGEPKEGWIDLSTGINPKPYPFLMPPDEIFSKLPDAPLKHALIEVARHYYSSNATIVAGAGSQAFIQSLPRLREKSRVGIFSPTYSEHAQAWSKAGHEVHAISELFDKDHFDVLIIVNPNNPNGRCFAPGFLVDLAKRQNFGGGWLIVDEAFCDVDPGASVAPHAGEGGLVVLRSFGKFFGLAGLRLGFAICALPLSIRLEGALGPWAVSGPALHIGRQALLDKGWHVIARQDLQARRKRLDAILMAAGYNVVGGTDLFRLIGTNGARLHRQLAGSGIWAREFDFSSDILRVGLPGDENDWSRVEAALA